MKKIKLVMLIIPLSIVLTNCKSTKKGAGYVPVEKQLSYETDIKPIITTSCTPCHIPPQGRKQPFDNYTNVKENISSIIARVSLPKDDKKFMPPRNKKPALNDSLVAVLVKWEKQNMPK